MGGYHTFDCSIRTASRELERRTYLMLWPHRCDTCKGEGYEWISYDPSPAGVALPPGYLIDQDPCIDCLDIGICPRCATSHVEEPVHYAMLVEDGICFTCDWDSQFAKSEPPPYECACWYELEEVFE